VWHQRSSSESLKSLLFPITILSLNFSSHILKNGTDAFEAWNPTYLHALSLKSQEVLDGERPAVVEIGPYTYREYRPMEQIDFQDNGTKVTAVNSKTYIFQRNMSRGPESDLIRTVNIPAMVSNRNLQHRSDLPLIYISIVFSH
uniref:Uncharacterized protein n=1 Tax=Oreochromis aureus TaxID=47969 RepID=A0AAZ1Y0V8_OREAU